MEPSKKVNNSFVHSGNLGDVISAMPSIRAFYEKTGIKPILYLRKGQLAFYYEGASHPVKNEKNEAVTLNQMMVDMATPLLAAQPYIGEVKEWPEEWEEQKVEGVIDLDLIRHKDVDVGMPYFPIQAWYFFIYPDLSCDLTKPWISVPYTDKDIAKGKIIVSLTERYRNPHINYEFLKVFEEDVLFTGTLREYNKFCMDYNVAAQKLNLDNFLQLAQAIGQCAFHISNQTMAFQISEGMKRPRMVELCPFAANVVPFFGEDCYGYLGQAAFEYYVKALYEKTKGA